MSALAGESASKSGSRDCEARDTPGAADAPDTHTLELTVWDVPPVTAAGERFTLVVGARCSEGCDLGGKALNLFDQHGSCACTVKLGAVVWPGTEALYFAKIEAQAPLAAGSHPWSAKMEGWDAEPPHAGGAFPLMVRVVAAPDCAVTVRVVDRETQKPITGARVVLHPYRAVTGDSGIASIKIAKGKYDILVSASRYLPVCVSGEVGADVAITTALDADQPDENHE
jgi:hypothetical protein